MLRLFYSIIVDLHDVRNYPDGKYDDDDVIVIVASVYVRNDLSSASIPGTSLSISYENAYGTRTTSSSQAGSEIAVALPQLIVNSTVEPL